MIFPRFPVAAAALLAAFCLLAASAARAGIQLDPGTWQQVETGSENGQPIKPEVTTSCMTPEDAREPVKALSALKGLGTLVARYCQTLQVHEEGNAASVDFECGEPQSMLIAVRMTFNFLDARHYTGTVKSRFAFKGHENSADKAIEAKWLGAECKKQ
jgi:Protein of unknown function (DUF3617)